PSTTSRLFLFLLFTSPPPPLISSLSLHDALPISISCCFDFISSTPRRSIAPLVDSKPANVSSSSNSTRSFRFSGNGNTNLISLRSEEHTSELQSRFDLVCRLLLEKKKKYDYIHLL